MAHIRTAAGFTIFMLSMLLFLPAGVFVSILHLAQFHDIAALFIYRIAQGWARFVVILTGCKVTVRGREHIPLKGGLCFVSNHSGIFDIVLMLAYAGRPFGFIAKKELGYLPILNVWILILGGLFIDRSNPRKALKTISNGVEYIKKGFAMVIFPEGTRSRGEGLLPFKPGAFKLALRSKAPLIPVAITGSYEVFERQKVIVSCPAAISFGPPLKSADFQKTDTRQELSEKVHRIIDEMLKNQ